MKPKLKDEKTNKKAKAEDEGEGEGDDDDDGLSDDAFEHHGSEPNEETGETGDLPESKVEEVQDDDNPKPDPEIEKQRERAWQAFLKAEIERERALDTFYQDSERAIKLF